MIQTRYLFHFLLVLLCAATSAYPQRYSFLKVIDTSEFTLAVAEFIAPDGTVLFSGLPKGGAPGSFLWLDGKQTRLPPVSGTAPGVGSMNSSGIIAAGLVLPDLSGGVFRISKDAEVTPAYVLPAPYTGDPFPRINEAGSIAFAIGTGLHSKVFRVVGSAAQMIAEVGGNLAGSQFLSDADINNRGEVAFMAGMGPLMQGGVYVHANGTLNRIVPEGPQNMIMPYGHVAPSINDAGVVVFEAIDASFRKGLRAYFPDGRLQTFAARGSFLDGPPFEDLERPTINNGNGIAFLAKLQSVNSMDFAIYALLNGSWHKVIRVGDALFGSIVTGIQLPRGEYLSDKHQLFFSYTLANGSGGLAIAGPGAGSTPLPSVTQNGVLNAASFVPSGQPGHAVSPGAVVSLFGSSLAEKLSVASTSPLTTVLDGTSVTFNGISAPLFFVSNGQINAQVPYGIAGLSAEVKVRSGAGESGGQIVQLATVSPALYTMNQQGNGAAIAVFANSATLVGALGQAGDSRPAKAGDTITLYANGLGAVEPSIAAGRNSCDPDGKCATDFSNLVLRRVVVQPIVEIGGRAVPAANIHFAGLAPEFVGLYQINLTLPPGLNPGNAVPIVIRQGTAASRADVTIAIQ